MSARLFLAGAVLLAAFAASDARAAEIIVGSKGFTESVVLGEIARLELTAAGIGASHRRQLGGSRILFNALRAGHLDVYAEYTGTLALELLADATGGRIVPHDELARHLRDRGLAMSAPLGFANNYALGMDAERAEALGIRRISDLAGHPGLRFGFGSEFMERADGWPSLRLAYGLTQREVRGMDHDLAYRALAAGAIDVVDLYTTDAEIAYYGIRILEDDRGHFPRYDAVWLHRTDLAAPARAVLHDLAGSLDRATMSRLNAEVKIDGRPETAVAAEHLDLDADVRTSTLRERLVRTTADHITLVAVSLGAAILVAIPLGILAAHRRLVGHGVLAFTGILQTVPSLAMFVFMIPLFGIGWMPAVAALFVYSLLPVVRNTHAGLTGIPVHLRESAVVLGLGARARLLKIELPLAAGSILAGIKTAAVINVGTATLAALIGAGGYGQPILTGIRLDDMGLIMEGAIPAAALALAIQWGFDALERAITPRGLRSDSGR